MIKHKYPLIFQQEIGRTVMRGIFIQHNDEEKAANARPESSDWCKSESIQLNPIGNWESVGLRRFDNLSVKLVNS